CRQRRPDPPVPVREQRETDDDERGAKCDGSSQRRREQMQAEWLSGGAALPIEITERRKYDREAEDPRSVDEDEGPVDHACSAASLSAAAGNPVPLRWW